MNRRTWIWAGAGALGAAGGLGAWHWQERRRPPPTPHDNLWSARLPTPDGGELDMASLRGRPIVLNFWATWCPPCVKEMPVLDAFQRAHPDRWHVVGWAIDQAAPVRAFLDRVPVGLKIGIAGVEGNAMSRALGNTQGALPFTAVFDAAGRLVERHLGETSAEQLEAWAQRHS